MRTQHTSIQHHLTDETLQEYSAGTLGYAMELVIACHLTYCAACRHRAELADAIGGMELEAAAPIGAAVSALDLLSRARSEASRDKQSDDACAAVNTDEPDALPPGIPRPLARLLVHEASSTSPAGSERRIDWESLKWKTIGGGVKQFDLASRVDKIADAQGDHPTRSSEPNKPSGAFKLLRLEPGTVLSEHGHRDRELTLVLKGAYSDSTGRFGTGDIADVDAEVEHQPVVEQGEVCIALIASDQPVKYKSMVGKIMQPFIGI